MNYLKQIERTNKRFLKATKKQKGVMLARDVIAQIDAGFFSAEVACYMETKGNRANPNQDLSEVIKDAYRCDLCAKGAIFAAAVLRLDNLPARHFVPFISRYCSAIAREREIVDYVVRKQKLFTYKQFEAIEDIFEEWDRSFGGIEFPEIGRTERLRLLMQNIIVNKGTVHPKRKVIRGRDGQLKIKGFRK